MKDEEVHAFGDIYARSAAGPEIRLADRAGEPYSFSDSDFSVCKRTAKSTSDGVIMLGKHYITSESSPPSLPPSLPLSPHDTRDAAANFRKDVKKLMERKGFRIDLFIQSIYVVPQGKDVEDVNTWS